VSILGSAEAWIIPGYLDRRDGRLTMDDRDLVDLAGERGTPLYVYSARRIVDTAQRLREAFQRADPRTTICFASKALSAIKPLRLLRDEGLSIEVNSGGELFRAGIAGFPPSAIVFNGVAKAIDELAAALSPPIKAINIDSLFELDRVAAVARGLGCRARVALRIVPGVHSPTSPGNQTGSAATKFGMLESELGAAIEILKAAPEALQLVGLHAHVGSQITDVAPYVAAVEVLARRVRDVEAALGPRLEHVNVGGGFPLPYMRGVNRTPQGDIFAPRIDAADIAGAALPALRKLLGPEIEAIVEPGRRMVGDAAVLLTRVENVKQRADGPWLYLDAGYNVIVESYTYKWYYHTLTANKLDEAASEFRLVGPLCDNGDAFFDVDGEQTLARLLAADPRLAAARDLLEATLVRLPPTRRLAATTKPGDLVAFLDAGAYTLDQMTPNNGRPRPEVGMIGLSGGYELIRRRESFADLLFNEIL
jgi:diaminopimelate decarboxylase